MRYRDVIWHKIWALAAVIVFYNGCSPANFSQAPAKGEAICNPFGGEGGTRRNGLAGTLHYLNDSQPVYSWVNEYFQNGHKVNATLYLNDLNVPTRLFSYGFAKQSGGALTREDGSLLTEKFAIKMASSIRLAPDDDVGYKQFVLLSDDGAIFTVVQNGQSKQIVNNDDVHPSRLGCYGGGGGIEAIYMDRNTSLPMKLEYFQGPRHHISLILMWRTVGGVNPGADNLCGVTDNDIWFDVNNGSQPKPTFIDLLSRGWRPLRPVNYWLDDDNPCVQ